MVATRPTNEFNGTIVLYRGDLGDIEDDLGGAQRVLKIGSTAARNRNLEIEIT